MEIHGHQQIIHKVGKENEPKQKLFAFKMDIQTHKRLMRYKTENGIPIGEYINSAILESLEKDGF